MIELRTVETGKGYSSKDKYRIFNEFLKSFRDMAAVDEYFKEYYGKCKRQKMYVDTKNGKTRHIGYIFCFRNSDISHIPVDKWLQQDWVSFYECKPLILSK